MPDTLSINEFAAKIRERRPDLANVPDGTLVGKLLAAEPSLKPLVRMEYSDKRGSEFQSPRYPGTGATPGQVAQDQAANVVRGVPEAVTGIPAAFAGLGGLGWKAVKGENINREAGQMVEGMVKPFQTTLEGATELAYPGSMGPEVAPESPEWAQAARSGGTMLAGAELPNALSGAKVAISPVLQHMKGLPNKAVSAVTSSPELNKWMNVTPKAMEHGANPAQQILGDKLLATTKEATKSNVKTALKTAGNEIEQSLLDATLKGAPALDAAPIVDNALNSVVKKIGTPRDPAFQANIAAIKSDIQSAHPNLNALTPKQTQSLISHLGDSINWHSLVENPINDALIQLYGELRRAQISTQVPQLEPLLSKWQNLYVADKSLGGSMLKDAAGVGTGKNLMFNKLKSGAKKAAAVGAIGGGLYAGTKILD